MLLNLFAYEFYSCWLVIKLHNVLVISNSIIALCFKMSFLLGLFPDVFFRMKNKAVKSMLIPCTSFCMSNLGDCVLNRIGVQNVFFLFILDPTPFIRLGSAS